MGADGITVTGADGITVTGADTQSRQTHRIGLHSVDPELALALNAANGAADDSNINAVIVYHQLPSERDLSDLQQIGILGGTRFHVLPAVYVSATPDQIITLSRLPNVRSIYGNRTLQLTADPAQGLTGVERMRRDADIMRGNGGLPVSGRGVTVAVLDTGVDSTHGDLAGRIAQNVKLADLQSAPAGFNYPANVENLPNTDQVYGHGIFVAGGIGASGAKSGGQYAGVAPGYVPFYTTASGTSFSAPQVAGVIALMLEANPRLTPAQVRDILQRTATPLPAYYEHEVGAGMLNTHAAVLEAAFPERRLGNFRATLNRGQVRFTNDPLQEISGTVAPGASGSETAVQIPADALMASMQIGWSALSVNDLGMAMYDASGVKGADTNAINLPGLTGNRERAVLVAPSAGAWTVKVKNTLGGLAATAQGFAGALEVARAEYAPLKDLEGLSASQRAVVYQNIRTFVMSPVGHKFRPAQSVTRGELAEALVLGGRVPQYVPAFATYRDVRNPATMLFIESVQHAPGGALFTDVERGGAFSPNDAMGRLMAAVVLVRAAGLQAEADAAQNMPLSTLDASLVPGRLRGYVRVALARGLLSTHSAYFRPQTPLTRLELAQAMAAMQKL